MRVVDASVLIDYADTDISVLSRACRHVGPVCVPRDVLAEVAQLDEQACSGLGILIADGTIEQLGAAGAARGPLSFEDRLCVIIARDAVWTCVTNDGPLVESAASRVSACCGVSS